MSNNPYAAYQTVQATTADPVKLTTMLYDGGIKALRKARLHHESQNRKAFLDETNRAYLIIGELLATLDMEQGELPKNLAGLYAYCMRLIVESSNGDMTKLEEVERHLNKIATAWKAATATFRTGGPRFAATETAA
jgi:flagellar protein FliS